MLKVDPSVFYQNAKESQGVEAMRSNQEIYNQCKMSCKCKTCGNDCDGVCGMDGTGCISVRKEERCPIERCANWKPREVKSTKFILYSCADCLDDDGNVLLFAFHAGGNVQNGVMTPIGCPLCQNTNSIVALKEVEIDTETGLS